MTSTRSPVSNEIESEVPSIDPSVALTDDKLAMLEIVATRQESLTSRPRATESTYDLLTSWELVNDDAAVVILAEPMSITPVPVDWITACGFSDEPV